MSDRSHALAWLPPFLVGGSAAVAAETCTGLLLYSGGGFLRALTLILATLLGALALGLWSAPDPGETGMVETLRRQWLIVLVAFTLAAATAGAWSIFGGLSADVLTRSIALALLGAIPLYATGALLGTMAAHRSGLGLRGPGSAAAAGAALGAVGAGLFLVRAVVPVATHIFILVALSGGALVHGRVLDRMVPPSEPEGDEAPPHSSPPPPPSAQTHA